MAKFHLNHRMVWHKWNDVNHPPYVMEPGDYDTDDLPDWLQKRMADKGTLERLKYREEVEAQGNNGDDDKKPAGKRGRPPREPFTGSGVSGDSSGKVDL